MKYDVVIVGAGLYGLTVAQQIAEKTNKKVLIIDKRDHIGGNAYSYFDSETGIEIHKYGSHLFHTSIDRVWEYVNEFTEFTGYVHRVFTVHNNETFPLPINLQTINQFFRKAYSPDEAKKVIAEQAGELYGKDPKNLNDKGISLIGRPLYEAFIKNYTAKQWQTPAEELDANIINRLPVRYNFNNRYFKDTYEGLPADGYEAWFKNMIKSDQIDVALSTDFFDESQPYNKKALVGDCDCKGDCDCTSDRTSDCDCAGDRGDDCKCGDDKCDCKDDCKCADKPIVIYTGPLDRYFGYSQGVLGWRTVDFEEERLDIEDYQGTPVMNYADLDAKFTRIVEFKHFNPERDYPKDKTIIFKEYSRFATEKDEPYYPIGTDKDNEMYAKYSKMTEEENKKNVYFGGRLGAYKYFDMDKTIDRALAFSDEFIEKLK